MAAVAAEALAHLPDAFAAALGPFGGEASSGAYGLAAAAAAFLAAAPRGAPPTFGDTFAFLPGGGETAGTA